MSVDIYPLELLGRFDQALAEIIRTGPDCDPPAILHRHGLRLVDPDRQRALIDEVVYAGACFRVGHFQRLADSCMRRRLPAADTWRFISRGLE
jgi:hypothetical protein